MGKNQDPGSGINIPDPQHWSLTTVWCRDAGGGAEQGAGREGGGGPRGGGGLPRRGQDRGRHQHAQAGKQLTSVTDPGSGAFLTPGSGMGKKQGPDPG